MFMPMDNQTASATQPATIQESTNHTVPLATHKQWRVLAIGPAGWCTHTDTSTVLEVQDQKAAVRGEQLKPTTTDGIQIKGY
jgi:hypothetical protein